MIGGTGPTVFVNDMSCEIDIGINSPKDIESEGIKEIQFALRKKNNG